MIFSIIIGIILGIAVPTLLPLIPNVTLDLGAQIIIGLLSGTIPILIDIQKSLAVMKETHKTELMISDMKYSFDIQLKKISDCYSKLDDLKNHGIFSTYFEQEVKSLCNAILDASQKKSFLGRVQNFVDEKYILDCFGSSRSKIWRFTWAITTSESPIVAVDDPGWVAYWNHALSLLRKKRISGFEILLYALNKRCLSF